MDSDCACDMQAVLVLLSGLSCNCSCNEPAYLGSPHRADTSCSHVLVWLLRPRALHAGAVVLVPPDCKAALRARIALNLSQKPCT